MLKKTEEREFNWNFFVEFVIFRRKISEKINRLSLKLLLSHIDQIWILIFLLEFTDHLQIISKDNSYFYSFCALPDPIVVTSSSPAG